MFCVHASSADVPTGSAADGCESQSMGLTPLGVKSPGLRGSRRFGFGLRGSRDSGFGLRGSRRTAGFGGFGGFGGSGGCEKTR